MDLEEYAGYSVDMQRLKKRGLQMREARGQKDSMRLECEWTPGREEDVLALCDTGKGCESTLLGESPVLGLGVWAMNSAWWRVYRGI